MSLLTTGKRDSFHTASTLTGLSANSGAVVEIAPEVDVALAAREDKNATQAAA